MKNAGYDDKTLHDSLGVACEALSQEGTFVQQCVLLGAPQLYADVIDATLRSVGMLNNYLEMLGTQMQVRGLAHVDRLLFPEEEEEHQTILRLIEADIDGIRNPQS